jgi:flagellar biosynthetic protein FliP
MKIKRLAEIALLSAVLVPAAVVTSFATDGTPSSGISINLGGGDTLQILITLTVIALIPSILIMTTCFTRIVIVLSCVRNAIGLQQTPPNQVLIGIALFLSLFIMSPVVDKINTEAYQPYKNGTMTEEEAAKTAIKPLREFMLKNTDTDDLNLFIDLGGYDAPQTMDDVKTTVVIPAFITSELKRAFTIGFLIYLPFLIIDMVVSSTLMSLGMMMLPPSMISLPFKLMPFVLVDGWDLIIKTLVISFN